MQQMIEALSGAGRKGDTEIAHVTPGEVVIPVPILTANPEILTALQDAMAKAGVDLGRYIVGGEDDSLNPTTGMREFYASDDSDTNGSGGTTGADPSNDGRMDSRDDSSWGGSDNSGGFNFSFGDTAPEGFYNSPGYDANGEGAYSPGREIGGGMLSFMGVSPAERASMVGPNETQSGWGFNPGAAIGGMAGSLIGGPIGGIAGSLAGRQFADTRFGGWGNGLPGFGSMGADPEKMARDGGANWSQLLMNKGA